MEKCYCSFDIEADGTNPMQHSMRSLGIVVLDENAIVINTFYKTILPQMNSGVCQQTMSEFWSKHQDMWTEVNTNAVCPSKAMSDLVEFLKPLYLKYRVSWIASPACFDWMWLKCYYETYGPVIKPNIGYFCHDLSSMLNVYMKIHKIQIENCQEFKNQLMNGHPYTHNALDDAKCQGYMYLNLRKLLTNKDKE